MILPLALAPPFCFRPGPGALVATTSEDVRELLRDQVLYKLPRRRSKAGTVCAFSPDGKWLLTCTGVDVKQPGKPASELRLHDAANGEFLRLLPQIHAEVTLLQFSPDGKHLALGSEKSVALWSTSTWKPLRVFSHDEWVEQLLFQPRGNLLLIRSGGLLHLYDVEKEDSVLRLESGEAPFHAAAVSADGRVLAAAYGEYVPAPPGAGLNEVREIRRCPIRLYTLPSGKKLADLPGHPELVHALAFRPDGRWLASIGHDPTVKIWDVKKRSVLYTLPLKGSGSNVIFTPDNRWLLTTDSTGVRLWNLSPLR